MVAVATRAGAGAVAVGLLTSGCGLQRAVDGQTAGGSGGPAPAIIATTLDGRPFRSAPAPGHPLVIDFWASWCGPCRAEQGDLNALHARYASRGVRFVGVDMRDDGASARAFAREFRVPYPSVADDGTIAAGYNVAAPPETVVVDPSGRIALQLPGTVVGASDALDRMLRAGTPGGGVA